VYMAAISGESLAKIAEIAVQVDTTQKPV